MPQLQFGDPLVVAQAVWMLVIFGVLYYVLRTYVLPPVGEVLENRAARIAGDLDAAREAKLTADNALAELRAATAQARAEAQSAIAGAVAQANAEAQARADVLSARLAEQVAAAETRIAASRDAAMATLRGVATDTATALLTKLVGRADAAAVDGAVGRALAARGNG
jgi:F-type H+-transporting ATPase subunit b